MKPENRFGLKILANMLFCGWALAVSLSFIFGFSTGTIIYNLILFDVIFNWGGLVVLAVINWAILAGETKKFMSEQDGKKEKKRTDLLQGM